MAEQTCVARPGKLRAPVLNHKQEAERGQEESVASEPRACSLGQAPSSKAMPPEHVQTAHPAPATGSKHSEICAHAGYSPLSLKPPHVSVSLVNPLSQGMENTAINLDSY